MESKVQHRLGKKSWGCQSLTTPIRLQLLQPVSLLPILMVYSKFAGIQNVIFAKSSVPSIMGYVVRASCFRIIYV